MDGGARSKNQRLLGRKIRKDHEDKDEAERKENQAESDKKKDAGVAATSLGGLLPIGTAIDAASSGGATSGGEIDSRKDSRVRKDKDEGDAGKGGKKTKTRQDKMHERRRKHEIETLVRRMKRRQRRVKVWSMLAAQERFRQARRRLPTHSPGS